LQQLGVCPAVEHLYPERHVGWVVADSFHHSPAFCCAATIFSHAQKHGSQ
jgi:hypothetical protein